MAKAKQVGTDWACDGQGDEHEVPVYACGVGQSAIDVATTLGGRVLPRRESGVRVDALVAIGDGNTVRVQVIK